jgi:hypothetical protein
MSTPRRGRYYHCRFCNTPFSPPRGNNTCSGCKNKLRNVRNRLILDGFLDAGCVDCGITDKRVLEVHHRVARNGREETATKNGRTSAQLQRHLEDCEVLCANCHKIRHYAGTVLDKYGDMVGPRMARKKGFDAPTTKVTPAMLNAMREDRKNGLTLRQIATKHGLGLNTAQRWLNRE